jgi:hypothetical protein
MFSKLASILVLHEMYLTYPLMRLHVPLGVHGAQVNNRCSSRRLKRLHQVRSNGWDAVRVGDK